MNDNKLSSKLLIPALSTIFFQTNGASGSSPQTIGNRTLNRTELGLIFTAAFGTQGSERYGWQYLRHVHLTLWDNVDVCELAQGTEELAIEVLLDLIAGSLVHESFITPATQHLNERAGQILQEKENALAAIGTCGK